MYDELIKSLRICVTDGDCKDCVDYVDGVECSGIFNIAWQAADAIEELQKQVDATPVDGDKFVDAIIKSYEQSRWIPVTERLPEEDERVLVVAHRINDNSPVVCIDFVETDEGELRFSLYMGVDYWMPLPEPPKDGES